MDRTEFLYYIVSREAILHDISCIGFEISHTFFSDTLCCKILPTLYSIFRSQITVTSLVIKACNMCVIWDKHSYY